MLIHTILTLLSIIIFISIINLIFKYINKTKSSVIIKFIRSLVLVIGLVAIISNYLSQFDFTRDLSKTLLQSGSLIIALVTFSCQQVLGNIVSGIVLSITKPFDIGDKIALLNTSGNIVADGIVTDMNIRHVVFKKPDGRFDFITNSIVDNCVVENSNVLEDNGRIFTIECSYESDVEIAIKLMQEEIERCPFTVKKDIASANVLCSNLNPSGYELKATIWANDINDSFKACSWLRIHIVKTWEKNNIDVPYNTITIKN